MQATGRPFALFENNLGEHAEAILLDGFEHALCVYTPGEFAEAMALIEAARSRGAWVALAAHYELGTCLEPRLPAQPGLPLLRAWIFSNRHKLSGAALDGWWQARLAMLTPQQREAGLLNLRPEWSEARHSAATQRILDYIHRGDCYQANLTFPLTGTTYGHPLALAAQLREAQPVAHGVLIHDGSDWIISRSPELFFSRHEETLTCRPMKGTASRSANLTEDAEIAARLRTSGKDLAENLMIVDLIRNDLGRLTPPGGVRVERLFELESYPTVHQLTSTVSAHPVSCDLPGMLQALFPCGSVTGAPKIRAMEIIHELEDSPRGLYCGALGWLAPDGALSLNVPIRTVLLDASGRCRLNAGSGIVADSNPASEYQECLAKTRFLSKLGDTLELIETLRWQPGQGYPLLAGHLARLSRSAIELGFICDSETVRQALIDLASTLPPHPHRIRLLLTRKGEIRLQAFKLEATPPSNSFVLADWPIDPMDPRLQHKTTARNFYDEALRSAMRQGHFDVVFCNTRGELCEGARSNLFLEIEGVLLTPPGHCGVLPGVLRADLLSRNAAREQLLYPEDLLRAQRIYLGNALRGLTEVTFTPPGP